MPKKLVFEDLTLAEMRAEISAIVKRDFALKKTAFGIEITFYSEKAEETDISDTEVTQIEQILRTHGRFKRV